MPAIDIKAWVDKGVRENPTQFKTLDGAAFDRTTTMSASSALSCLRQQAYKRMGFEPDADYDDE